MIHPYVVSYLQGLVVYGILLLAGGGLIQFRRNKKRSAFILFGLCAFMVVLTVAVRILRTR